MDNKELDDKKDFIDGVITDDGFLKYGLAKGDEVKLYVKEEVSHDGICRPVLTEEEVAKKIRENFGIKEKVSTDKFEVFGIISDNKTDPYTGDTAILKGKIYNQMTIGEIEEIKKIENKKIKNNSLGEAPKIGINFKKEGENVNFDFAVSEGDIHSIFEKDHQIEHKLKNHPSFGTRCLPDRFQGPLNNPEISGIDDKTWKEMCDPEKIMKTVEERTVEEDKDTSKEKTLKVPDHLRGQGELKELDVLLKKIVNQKDVNDAYTALRKITNKDNAVGALSIILAERLERLITKKR